MNDELKKKLVEYLGTLETAANSAGDFVATQMPDVIQQYLAWEFYSAVFFMVVNLTIIIILAVLTKLSFKKLCEEDLKPLVIVPTVLIIMFTAFFVENGYNATKVYVAPKVVLLEKAAELVKGK